MTTPSRAAARRVALARLISLTGTEAAAIALLFTLYQRTGSSRWLSLALLVTFGTRGALTPVAGSLGDRFDRRRVMIISDLLGAGCFLALAVARTPGQLVALAFVAAALETPFFPAASASVPNLVLPEELSWANGTIAFGTNVGYLLGPAIGGILAAAIGAPAVFLANAGSFALSALLVRTVRGPFAGERSGEHPHGGIREGFRFIMAEPVLRTMVVAFGISAVGIGSVLVAELPLARSFGAGATGYGMIATAFGVGALGGTLAARRLTPRTETPWLVGASFVTAAGFAVIAVAPAFWFVLVAMLVCGASDGLVDVAVENTFQRRSPDRVRSRVIAGLEAVFLLGLAASFLFAGPMIDALGPKFAYGLAGAGCAVTAVLLVPLLRSSRRPQPVEAAWPPTM